MNSVKLYSKFNSYQQVLNTMVIKKKVHLLKFKPGENLFEVGCGPGGSTKTLLQHIPLTFNKYVATDKLISMINHAKAENIDVHFDQLDISDKCINPAWVHSFEKVFSFFALQWIAKEMQTQAFRNINILLKINGCTFLSSVADTPIQETYAKMYKDKKWTMYMPELKFIYPYKKSIENREQNLKNILKENQFYLNDMDFIDINYNFKTSDESMNTIKAINPFIKHIPKELHEAYWEDLWKALETFSDVMTTGDLTTMTNEELAMI